MSGLPQQNIPPRHAAGFNSSPAHVLPNLHGQPVVPAAFAHSIPPRNQYLGPSGFASPPSAEVYCQLHEVTVMVCALPFARYA